MAIQTVNPTTGKLIKQFKPTTASEVERRLSRAQKAFQSWSKLTVAARIKYVQRLSEYLEKEKQVLGRLVTLEMGRVYADSVAEISKSASVCKYYIQNGEKFLQEQHVPTEAAKSYIEYAPLGIILGIMPWNFPFYLVFRPLIPALVAGNVFVLKHASNVPQCALAIEEMFSEDRVSGGSVY